MTGLGGNDFSLMFLIRPVTDATSFQWRFISSAFTAMVFICEPTHPRAHLVAKVSTPFRWTQPEYVVDVQQILAKSSISARLITILNCAQHANRHLLRHEHSKFWEVTIPENALYSPEERGNNPLDNDCDARGPRCTKNCVGIHWKCLICQFYDMCEACEQPREFSTDRGHNLTHPLLKLYDYNHETTLRHGPCKGL
ncbi:hypothetical protein Pelo_17659 [Pelomyxa schiedti]|nr:hypothetical protein Pelo_17659 [Pelomyxa schiedti]